ncbi:MAG: TM2 domain-containing protein [Cyanobacteria bacterium P01_A01_bin.114]
MKPANPLVRYETHLRDRKNTSYILWLGLFFGAGGLHRLYNGKIFSGLLWFFTWGLFGFGQFIDLFLIPEMAETRARRLFGKWDMYTYQTVPTVVEKTVAEKPGDSLMMQLLKLAQSSGGRITVTQSVIATGEDFQTVEKQLKEMVKLGYVDTANDPHSGIVFYEFRELMQA